MPFSAKKFRAKIKESGLTAYRIMKIANLPNSTMIRLKKVGGHQNPTLDLMERLAGAMGCEVADFLDPIKSHTRGAEHRKSV